MAIKGPSTLARVYYPFKDTPDLFPKFKDLDLNPDLLWRFANQYGWIGERGMVKYARIDSIRAVGLSTWAREIQDMNLADR